MSQATDGPQRLRNRFFTVNPAEIVAAPETTSPAVSTGGWVSSRAIVVALVLVGIVLRFIPLLQNRCLWIDEAMLALNLIERSPRQLLEPLDWNQGAPAGFLLSVKAMISVFGASEWSLRLVAFFASILGLIGFAWLSRRSLPAGAATLAVALFAISPSLISYSAECKQYESDASFTIALFAAAAGLLNRERGAGRWVMLGAAGAIAVWFSHPAVFVLSAIGSALFLDSLLMRDRRRTLACLAAISAWLVSFGACYILTLRRLGTNQYLLDYWAGQFMPLPPTSAGDFSWLLGHLSSFVEFPGSLGGTDIKAGGVAAALFLVGLYSLLKERWTLAAVLIAPAGFALIASGLHKYPFAGRLLLFLVPLLLFGVARGAWAVVEAVQSSLPFAAWALLGLLLAAPALESYQQFRRPPRYEQITEVMDEVRQQWRSGDKVYLYYGAVPAYTFYTRDREFVPDVVKGTEFRNNRTGYRDELRTLAGERRIWVIFSHRHQAEESLLRAYAEGLGECRQEIRRPGAAAFLFDFSSK
jgi:4-amino-4-deoxy-L-arabinose transferase-like glycosyltransferase